MQKSNCGYAKFDSIDILALIIGFFLVGLTLGVFITIMFCQNCPPMGGG